MPRQVEAASPTPAPSCAKPSICGWQRGSSARTAAVAAILLFAPGDVRSDEWTATDTALQASFTALVAIDWLQTRVALREPRFVETNPLLGARPSAVRLNLATLGAVVAHAGIARLLPQPYRRIWQSIGIGIEVAVVAQNFSVGVRLQL